MTRPYAPDSSLLCGLGLLTFPTSLFPSNSFLYIFPSPAHQPQSYVSDPFTSVKPPTAEFLQRKNPMPTSLGPWGGEEGNRKV